LVQTLPQKCSEFVVMRCVLRAKNTSEWVCGWGSALAPLEELTALLALRGVGMDAPARAIVKLHVVPATAYSISQSLIDICSMSIQ